MLYRLPELVEGDQEAAVFVVGCEVDADLLGEIGVVATTCVGGLGGWRREYSAALVGRDVVLLAGDGGDGAGEALGAVGLELQGFAESVRVVRLPVRGGDVGEWIATGGSALELEGLARATRARGWSERGPVAIVERLSEVTPERVGWLWEGWLPRGKLAILGGHPGDGKSTLTAAFGAVVSRGGTWPDGTTSARGGVLYLLAEDGLGDTLRPRLEAHGADLERVVAVRAIREADGSRGVVSLAEHLAALERRIVEEEVALVVIDPLMGFLPAKGRSSEGAIREVLTPVVEMAERRDVAVLGVMHVGKEGAGRRTALQTLLGPTVFGALARVVMMTGGGNREMGIEGVGRRMVLGVVKSNVGVKPGAVEWSRPVDSAIVWHGAAGCSMEEVLERGRRGPERRGALETAVELLRELLADGPVASREVEAAMLAAGVSVATLRRAKEEIGVVSRRASGSKVAWLLELSGKVRR